MSQNDQYVSEKHGSKTQVALLLIVVVGVVLGVLVYQRSGSFIDTAMTGTIASQPISIVPTLPEIPASAVSSGRL